MGAQRIRIANGVTITNDRCLLLDDGPTAVIGDLHLGYESALEDEGMFIPRINTESVREDLDRLLGEYEPARVILLGDIKHDFRRSSFQARDEVREIIRLVTDAAETIVIKGNHDNYLQNIIADKQLTALDWIDIGGYRLEHGHVDSGHRPVIIGHEHPSVRIPGELSGGMKMQCFVYARTEGVIVIPPFSPFAAGSDLNLDGEAIIAPALQTCNVGAAEIYGVTEVGLMDLGRLRDLADVTL